MAENPNKLGIWQAQTLLKIINKITRLYSSTGSADATLIVLDRALSAVSAGRLRLRRYYLFSQPLGDLPELPSRRGSAIRVRQIETLDPIFDIFPRPTAEIETRLAAGAKCLVAEVNHELAGFLWYVTGSWDDPESNVKYRLVPESSSAWDFDVYVSEKYRIGFVFYKLWAEAARRFDKRGITASASIVWAHNEDSIRAHRRLGAYPIGSALHVQVGRSVLHIADRIPRVAWIRPGALSPQIDVVTGPCARKRYRRFSDSQH